MSMKNYFLFKVTTISKKINHSQPATTITISPFAGVAAK